MPPVKTSTKTRGKQPLRQTRSSSAKEAARALAEQNHKAGPSYAEATSKRRPPGKIVGCEVVNGKLFYRIEFEPCLVNLSDVDLKGVNPLSLPELTPQEAAKYKTIDQLEEEWRVQAKKYKKNHDDDDKLKVWMNEMPYTCTI